MKFRKTYLMAALAAIALVVAIALIIELSTFRKAQNEDIIARATATTELAQTDLQSLLSDTENAARELGESFGRGEYDRAEVEARLQRAARAPSGAPLVTACFEPFGFSPVTKLFCPYYNRTTSAFAYVEDSYDYTVPGSGTAWYNGVVENGATWAKPYFGASAQDWFLGYGVPFTYAEGDKAGQVRGIIDYTLQVEGLKDFVHERTVGRSAYDFLTAPDGTIIVHPVADLIGTQTLEGLGETESNPALTQAYAAMERGERGYVEFRDAESGEDMLFFYASVEPADFRLGVMFARKDMVGPASQVTRRIINIALAISLFLILIIGMIFGRDRLDYWEIEQLSWLTTALLIANVLLVGFLQHSKERTYDENESPAIVDTTALGAFIDDVEARAERLVIEPPIQAPFGIWVERLEFADSYNVNMAGEMWAKYPADHFEEVEVGLHFPQISPFAESAYFEEVHREEIPAGDGIDGYVHVIWEYRMTLRLNLRYGDFPFDKRHLDMEIMPISLDDDIVFVPDLAGYENTNPSQNPGISSDVSLPGSDITKAYFNFSTVNYPTDFGFQSGARFQAMPVLHYNIYLKRKLINAFITYLIPIFVTLALIYILILACEKTEARQGIIESMAAFFFVLIFSHIDLRKDIVTAELIFIEYFYFITYLMVILSTANLIAYTKSKTPLFDFNDNQAYRAVYFPIFFSLILIVMLSKFY